MEHEFWFEGRKPIARLPMEQEALGAWLTDEIRDDMERLNALITTVESLLNGTTSDYRWHGKETLLTLTQQEAEVTSHSLLQDDDIALEDESLDLHDCDQQAGCGLEDFHELLLFWKDFITG